MATYRQFVELLTNGEAVSAEVTNRPLSQLQGNVKYLKDLFDAADLGSAQFARQVTVESAAAVGMPVYFNPTTNQFERGLSGATTDNETGALLHLPSSLIWGVVFYKHNSTMADLLIGGYAPLNISAAVNGSVTAGVYYLSGTTPGFMSLQPYPVTIPVLQTDGNGNVLLRASFSDFFNSHKHYKFNLACVPAGTHTDPGSSAHTISSPDVDIEGWLPANHASFNSHAPTNAQFGYNLEASILKNAWPPIPLSSVSLIWNRGENKDYAGMEVELGGANPQCIIDQYGIWWMNNCNDDVPWLTALNTASPPAAPTPGACPRQMEMTMVLYFTKMTFQTSNSVVTSLVAAANSPLLITCVHDGEDASTGDLQIALDFSLLVDEDDDEPGFLAFKRMQDGTFFRGPVVSQIRSLSSSLVVSGTGPGNGTYKDGVITLTLTTTPIGGEFPVETVHLNGATLENYEGTLGIGFPADKESNFVGKVKIPAELGGATAATIKLRLVLLTMADGDIPPITITYRKLTRPGQTAGTAVALPTSSTALTFTVTAGAGMVADEYIEIESAAFAVAPGDQVLFTITRDGETDSYTDEIHVLDQRAVLTGVS